MKVYDVQENNSARWDERAQYWDKEIASPTHYVNLDEGYKRFDTFLADILLKKSVADKILTVLDLACGTGEATHRLRDLIPFSKKWVFDGLDFSPKMLDLAKSKNIFRNLYLLNAESFTLPVEYDIIFSRGILFSRLSPEGFSNCLECLRKYLKKDGLFVFDVFNAGYNHKKENLTEKRLFAIEELKLLLEKHHFRIVHYEGNAHRTWNICCGQSK